MCKYKHVCMSICSEPNYRTSEYCILHINLPKDVKSEEFIEINTLKEAKVRKKIDNEDYSFEGVKLFNLNLADKTILGNANFMNCFILNDVEFKRIEIGEYVWFDWAKIGGNLYFDYAKIGGDALFKRADINGDAWFNGAEIGGNVSFDGADISGSAWFMETKISGSACLDGAKIGGNSSFNRAEIGGLLDCRKSYFKLPESQEKVCRKARRIYEEQGDRAEADYYFYREMEAKRKQKNPIARFLEFPIQFVFGYGTRWYPLLITWFFVVLSFGVIYWRGGGVQGATSLWDNMYFSVVTATTLGYGDFQPVATTIVALGQNVPIFRVLVSIEAVFGTFIWAAFITIFARKYMR